MFKLKIKSSIKAYSKDLLTKYNFGKRGNADGSLEEQLTGLIGQNTILDALNFPLITGKEGFDGGFDLILFGKKVDIKTMGRTTDVRDYYVNNFIGLQKNYKTDLYIFCSLNKLKEELTICGWITKKDLLNKADFYKKGEQRVRSDGSSFKTKADLYEIKNSKLINCNSFLQMQDQIRRIING